MLDHFQMGPNLVRGFAPAGIGPRDLTPGTTNDALGGSMYWGASVEVQTPLYFLPKEIGIKLAAFADAGSLWDYQGPTLPVRRRPDRRSRRIQVGLDKFSDGSLLGRRRLDLGFAARSAALRSSLSADEILRAQVGGGQFATARRYSASAAARSSDLGRELRTDTAAMSEPVFFKIRPRPHARRDRR